MILRLVKPGMSPLIWAGTGAWVTEADAKRRGLEPVDFATWGEVYAADGLAHGVLHHSRRGFCIEVET